MEQQRPIIGVTVSRDAGRLVLNEDCEKAVLAGGGLPLPLPVHIQTADAAALLAHCDGILFSGGPDLDPAYYGEEVLAPCGAIDTERDAAEAAYFAAAQQLRLPVLGICRGHQVINVLLGGDLYQDIDTQLPRTPALQHSCRGPFETLLHTVRPTPGSLLAQLVGEAPVRVTSTHHQAARRVACGLRACGFAPDGIVEALEGTGEDFLLCVQWHPERRFDKEDHALALFQALVEAARRHREARP